jgi:ABC-type Mn2+/Zn2+ transport system permease subunit
MWAETIRGRLLLGWLVAIVASTLGIAWSFAADYPTGPAIVLMLAVLLVASSIVYAIKHAPVKLRAMANIAAIGLNILIGYTGQISLGHGAFFGVGAYAAAILATRVGFPFWLSVIGAGMMGHGIAQIFAIQNYNVTLLDVRQDLLSNAIENIRSNLTLLVQKGIGDAKEIEPTIQRIKQP